MRDKVREAGEYVAALKRAACGSGDKQADAYLSDMIDSVVGIVRAAALEEAKAVVRSSCLGDIPGCNRTCCPGCHTIAAERIGALAGRGA